MKNIFSRILPRARRARIALAAVETLQTRTISIVFQGATVAVGGVTGVFDSAAKGV